MAGTSIHGKPWISHCVIGRCPTNLMAVANLFWKMRLGKAVTDQTLSDRRPVDFYPYTSPGSQVANCGQNPSMDSTSNWITIYGATPR